MTSIDPQQRVSRRRLLLAAGTAGVAAAAASVVPWPGATARADAPIQFGVGPFDRALNTLTDNGYRLQSAGLTVNDQDGILVDGTQRTRRVLYNYADQVGPYIDSLGELAGARHRGQDLRYDRLARVREDFNVYNAPVFQPRFYGMQRVFVAGQRFGFGLVPTPGWDGFGRPWPAGADFWGMAYAIDGGGIPFVWLMISTAEYRAFGPGGASQAVRTQVVVEQAGNASWYGYQAEQAILATPLRRGSRDYFSFPNL